MQPLEDNNLEPGTSQSIIDFVHVLAKHSRMIFRVTLAAALISIVHSLFLSNIYTAKTMILPAQEDKGMMSAMMAQLGGLATLAGGGGGVFGGTTTTDLYVSLLRSEAVKDPIIERFNLQKFYKKKYRVDVYDLLNKSMSVTPGKKDGLITIAVDDKDPKRAAALANAYVEELGKLAVRLNVTGAGQNRTFLEERLSKAKGDLAKAEDDLKAFQAKNKAVQVTAQAEATIKGLADLKAQLAVQEVKLAQYRRQFTDSSQEVKSINASVQNLRAQIAQMEGTGGNSAIPSVGSVPTLEREYIRRMREFKIQESLVELLTKQYEMARLSEAKDISPFQVLQSAKVPERKSKPNRTNIVILSTVAAFFIGVLLSFVREYIAVISDEDKARWREVVGNAGVGVFGKPISAVFASLFARTKERV